MKNKSNTFEIQRIKRRIEKAVRRISRGKNVEHEQKLKDRLNLRLSELE